MKETSVAMANAMGADTEQNQKQESGCVSGCSRNPLEFYRMIKEADSRCSLWAVTVVKGKYLGEKALFSDGVLLWESVENGFFSRKRIEQKNLRFGEILCVDGSSLWTERLGREKKLVICGGGHISIPLILMGRMLGFAVTVLEDRPKFADDARRAGAETVRCMSFDRGLETVAGDDDTFFVIVTRGHRYDQLCLEQIIQKKHAYIGMIGSKKRVASVKTAILEKGGSEEILQQLHSPIGLDIGAETPEEIAVAILAEIIEEKNRKQKEGGYSRKLLQAILENGSEKAASQETTHMEGNFGGGSSWDDPALKREMVLATIIRRKGSAPRSVGAKMLIRAKGGCVGTIGGGCAESEVEKMAFLMMQEQRKEPQICRIDLTGAQAEEEGMVCGGVIDVLLERIVMCSD